MSAFLRFRWLFGGGRRVLRSCCCGNRKSPCSLEARFFSFVPRKETFACHSAASTAGQTQRFLRTSAFLLRDKNPDLDHLISTDENQSVISLNNKKEKTCTNTPSESEIVHVPIPEEPSGNDVSLADSEPLIIETFTDVFEKPLPKCPGCGAVFQSDDPEKLGYVLPSKNPTTGFLDKDPDIATSKPLVCQKCFNLKHYNKPFPATLSRDEILDYLRHLKRRKGLILYVVDMLDLPGSLFPSLLDTVGDAKRIIVVGNKVDMLPVDGHTGKQEEHMINVLSSLCKTHGLSGANVKSVCLISAKSGFGILQLASKILEHWDHKGDIYLIGCSNAGKTTLFNLLLDLLSVHKKADLLQRATVSLWPCTTQRLLRFPIGHWMLKRLCRRLREGVQTPDLDDTEIDLDDEIMEREFTNYMEVTRTKKGKLVPLETMQSEGRTSDLAVLKPSFVMVEHDKHRTWLYDTPGIISEKQITNMLTMEELKLLNPTLWLVPRTFILKPGESMLLGGLGRLDYLEIKRRKPNASDGEWDTVSQAAQSVFFTVFTSPNVPVHVCKVTSADAVYAKHAGQELLKIPCGGKERMETFPELKSCDFTVKGVGLDRSAADVVLSNLGWVAVTAGFGSLVTVQAHTPNGTGLDIRKPLCPTCVTKRGKRGVMYQGYSRIGQYQSTRRQHPQFVPLARGEHWGERKWMQEIKRKRKEQRFLLKAEKWTKDTEKSFLGRSAISNPPQIPGAVGISPPRRRLKSGSKT